MKAFFRCATALAISSAFLSSCGSTEDNRIPFKYFASISGPQHEFFQSLGVNGSDVFCAGYFEDTATFRTAAGDERTFVSNSTDVLKTDFFLGKCSLDGKLDWVVAIGGTGTDTVWELAVLDGRGVAVTGYFEDTVRFHGTDGYFEELTALGQRDAYVAVFDTAGVLEWVFRIGGNRAEGVSIDAFADGSLAATGTFMGNISFESSNQGQVSLTSNGLEDMYLIKLDPTGRAVWWIQAGGSSRDFSKLVRVTPDGNFFWSGSFQGSASVGSVGGPGQTLTASGHFDAFLASYGSDGALNWLVQGGGGQASQLWVSDIEQISGGDIVITGFHIEDVTLGCTSGQGASLEPRGRFETHDSFLARYDPDGGLVWARNFGGWDHDLSVNHVVLPDGSIVVVGFGSMQGFVVDGISMTYFHGEDGYIMRFDDSGHGIWGASIGGMRSDALSDVLVLDASRIMVVGSFTNDLKILEQDDCWSTFVIDGEKDGLLMSLDRNVMTR